jgi:hypothetical protein
LRSKELGIDVPVYGELLIKNDPRPRRWDLAFDVTGYVARYNAQWERAAQGLRALMLSARGAAAPSGSGAEFAGNLIAIYKATDPYSCGGAGGMWDEQARECKQKP